GWQTRGESSHWLMRAKDNLRYDIIKRNSPHDFYIRMMCAELAGDFHLGDSRQLTDKSLLPFDLVS
ncbi:hypothetical protein ENC20_14415, partial [Acinetobacter indicus]